MMRRVQAKIRAAIDNKVYGFQTDITGKLFHYKLYETRRMETLIEEGTAMEIVLYAPTKRHESRQYLCPLDTLPKLLKGEIVDGRKFLSFDEVGIWCEYIGNMETKQ